MANRIDAVTFGELAAEVRLLGGDGRTPLYSGENGDEHLELPVRSGICNGLVIPVRAMDERVAELEAELENLRFKLEDAEKFAGLR